MGDGIFGYVAQMLTARWFIGAAACVRLSALRVGNNTSLHCSSVDGEPRIAMGLQYHTCRVNKTYEREILLCQAATDSLQFHPYFNKFVAEEPAARGDVVDLDP